MCSSDLTTVQAGEGPKQVAERAERRFKENQEKGIPTDLETLDRKSVV